MSKDTTCDKKTLAIVVGGGPAPGINGVIGSVTIEAANNGLKVLGIYDGFKWLVKGDASHVVELDPQHISRVHLQGGSILRTSRENPTTSEEKMANVTKALRELGVGYLVTIGGDDTAYSSRKVAEAFGGEVQVVHVPKTVDNDLPLMEGQPTFGYQTARDVGAKLVQNLLEDSKTTGRWYFVIAMGRSAGHLALGMAKSAGAHLCLIPEEFDQDVPMDTLLDMIEGTMLKRKAMGRPDGVAVMAEGVGLKLDPKVWENEPLATIKHDEHGHVRLAEVDLGRIIKREIEKRFKARDEKITIVAKDIGYELRCAPPCAFDCEYTRNLGCGAVQFLLGQLAEFPVKPGCMMGMEGDKVVVLDLDDLKDPDSGRTAVRRVNLDNDQYKVAVHYQLRITKADLACDDCCAKIAEAGKMTIDELRAKFGPVAN